MIQLCLDFSYVLKSPRLPDFSKLWHKTITKELCNTFLVDLFFQRDIYGKFNNAMIRRLMKYLMKTKVWWIEIILSFRNYSTSLCPSRT